MYSVCERVSCCFCIFASIHSFFFFHFVPLFCPEDRWWPRPKGFGWLSISSQTVPNVIIFALQNWADLGSKRAQNANDSNKFEVMKMRVNLSTGLIFKGASIQSRFLRTVRRVSAGYLKEFFSFSDWNKHLVESRSHSFVFAFSRVIYFYLSLSFCCPAPMLLPFSPFVPFHVHIFGRFPLVSDGCGKLKCHWSTEAFSTSPWAKLLQLHERLRQSNSWDEDEAAKHDDPMKPKDPKRKARDDISLCVKMCEECAAMLLRHYRWPWNKPKGVIKTPYAKQLKADCQLPKSQSFKRAGP